MKLLDDIGAGYLSSISTSNILVNWIESVFITECRMDVNNADREVIPNSDRFTFLSLNHSCHKS